MRLTTLIVLVLSAAALMAGPSDRACGTLSAQGTCCCTMPNGLQCCGASVNCGAGIVSGCPCSSRLGG